MIISSCDLFNRAGSLIAKVATNIKPIIAKVSSVANRLLHPNHMGMNKAVNEYDVLNYRTFDTTTSTGPFGK